MNNPEHLKVVPYQNNHKSDCLSLFQSNIPQYFTREEFDDFKKWLDDREGAEFFVLYDDNRPVGCGGIAIESNHGKLVWGLIRQSDHKKGYGKYLTLYRVDQIRKKFPSLPIKLETSQFTYLFFEKFGFKTIAMTPQFYYGTFDKYEMVLK